LIRLSEPHNSPHLDGVKHSSTRCFRIVYRVKAATGAGKGRAGLPGQIADGLPFLSYCSVGWQVALSILKRFVSGLFLIRDKPTVTLWAFMAPRVYVP